MTSLAAPHCASSSADGTPVAEVDPRAAPPRDHALPLFRLVAGGQLLGGATLISGYGLGAPALPIAMAIPALLAVGVLQVSVGLVWLARPRAMRAIVVERPGAFVAITLALATLTAGFGGSSADSVFATSAMSWLAATGIALPGARWLAVGAASVLVDAAVWALLEDEAGASLTGDLGTSVLALAIFVAVALWIGRAAAEATQTLNRWHVIELHERGAVGRLRPRLKAIDARAAILAAQLGAAPASREIATLRARLRSGVGLKSDLETVKLGDVLDALGAERGDGASPIAFAVRASSGVRATDLPSSTADALVSVLRRQFANVDRHAPSATMVTISVGEDGAGLRIRIEDDGGGRLPIVPGTGTKWSDRQLSRFGGTGRYLDGAAGLAYEVMVPAGQPVPKSTIHGLSITSSVDRFGFTMLTALRVGAYLPDSIFASAQAHTIGLWWLLMPAGALVTEAVIQFGVPGRVTTRDQRLIVATFVTIGLVAAFSIPAGSPAVLVPASTGSIVVAHLLFVRRTGWWAGLELLRLIVVAPALVRHGAEALQYAVLYPLAFSLLVFAINRFFDRARSLERTSADAVGRTALVSAAVRGLSLRHDAIDVVVRTEDRDGALRAAAFDLEQAIVALRFESLAHLDPRESLTLGLQASMSPIPVKVDAEGPRTGPLVPAAIGGAVDRVTMIELGALAAAERASCAPPGLFGRRRLRTLSAEYRTGRSGRGLALTLTAEPTLRPPGRVELQRLELIAGALGLVVTSGPAELRIERVRRPPV